MQQLALTPHRKRVNRLLHVPPVTVRALSGFSHSPLQSRGMHVRLTGESKLAVGVMLNMISCVSLCVCPVQPVQGVTLLSAYDSWDRLQPACDPELDNRMMKDG